jgi:hypothetical protein
MHTEICHFNAHSKEQAIQHNNFVALVGSLFGFNAHFKEQAMQHIKQNVITGLTSCFNAHSTKQAMQPSGSRAQACCCFNAHSTEQAMQLCQANQRGAGHHVFQRSFQRTSNPTTSFSYQVTK